MAAWITRLQYIFSSCSDDRHPSLSSAALGNWSHRLVPEGVLGLKGAWGVGMQYVLQVGGGPCYTTIYLRFLSSFLGAFPQDFLCILSLQQLEE